MAARARAQQPAMPVICPPRATLSGPPESDEKGPLRTHALQND
jgi:hypothetical protein